MHVPSPGGFSLTATISAAAVTVAVLASEPLVAAGAVACLRECPGITPVPPDRLDQASVVLIIAGQVGEKTLALIQRTAELVPGREPRFVLVCDQIRDWQLLQALSHGKVSVLSRQDSDYGRIARALVKARDGQVELPADTAGWLAGRIRTLQRDVLDPHGLSAAGLYIREVDVLRLLAEGLDTAEVAQRLNYSERTVRSIIHGALTRMNLRNRTHAVAFALRSGVM
jgi:DNA-binding NarL/FixJ family response regulator